jgi:hypothetical protein
LKFAVVAPIGGFGNHLRWLMLLDKQFSLMDIARHQKNIRNIDVLENKVEFIKINIYPVTRSWHNWLKHEWGFRVQLENQISFSHYEVTEDFATISESDRKTIALVTDPDLAYRGYVKFNTSTNGRGMAGFKHEVISFNRKVTELAKTNKNIRLLDGAKLFQDTLDQNLYNSAAEWFQAGNNYTQANDIHQIWYSLHKKAEKEILEHFQDIYNL